ncbi:ATP-grasp domain-containing protein [Methanocalculus sp.]|uniref:carboxylate--amine ligase n=1 Tax=Methanocalculus sp. TaxID=2004547 RepID=UPI00261B9071|nr:ATP-grasp domain-containing protein [Methanocalculus sp.]MDG6250467.1 ATP-grasp domain-containing protein [Methanocalculus sp.]
MGSVFVTDGRSRAALAIVRSLGKKGIKVIAGESMAVCSTFFSKYVQERVVYPDPDRYPEQFADFMHDFVKNNDLDMIIPVRDSTTLTLSKFKQRFSPYVKIPLADYETLTIGRDKAKTIRLAEELNIPHPKTTYTEHPDFERIKEDFSFPVVVKPRESSGSRGIIYVQSPEELEDAYLKSRSLFGNLMVQEFIPYGGAYGTSLLLNQGEVRAFFSHKRIREYPISGGPSTLREGIRNPKLERYAMDLLTSIKWHGVAMVEFRKDSRTDEYKLMEINPRFWGSLALPIFSGVDFPYLLYRMTIDGDVEPVCDYPVGMRSRWLIFGDILWLLGSSNKITAIPEFLKFRNENLCYDTLSVDDPFPALGAVLEGFISFTNKGRREHAFNRGWTSKNRNEALK